MDPYVLFNRKLSDFISDLKVVKSEISASTDIPDLDLMRTGINFASTLDVTNPHRVFNKQVAIPYEARILQKDENFFMNESYAHADIDFDIIDVIKKAWSSITAQNKTAIWQHLQILLLLNRRCLEQV